MVTRKKHSKDFLEGVRFAEELAERVAQEWQQSENPDWHGGVAAAREIVKRLRQAQEPPVQVSETQRHVLREMAKGWRLYSYYEMEQGEERSGVSAPALWNDHLFTFRPQRRPVLLLTLNKLVQLGLIEEEHRYKSGEPMQGNRQWERWTIIWKLTQKGQAVAE